MFIIEKLFIDDTKLSKVLIALAGLTISMEAPRPVINAVVKRGKIKANSSSSSLRDLYRDKLIADFKDQRVTKLTMNEIVEGLGGAFTSVGKMNSDLVADKILKRIGRGHYQVL